MHGSKKNMQTPDIMTDDICWWWNVINDAQYSKWLITWPVILPFAIILANRNIYGRINCKVTIIFHKTHFHAYFDGQYHLVERNHFLHNWAHCARATHNSIKYKFKLDDHWLWLNFGCITKAIFDLSGGRLLILYRTILMIKNP